MSRFLELGRRGRKGNGRFYVLYRVAARISSLSSASVAQRVLAHMIWFTASDETLNGHKPGRTGDGLSYRPIFSWEEAMITSLTIVLLLIVFGFGGNAARADGGCGASCGGRGLFAHTQYTPNVTYYAPYPVWFPQYFGPPYSDYLVSQYVTPPAETAVIVKQRILAINAVNPALPPAPKITLPSPKPDNLPPPQR